MPLSTARTTKSVWYRFLRSSARYFRVLTEGSAQGEYVFARALGQKAVSPQAARAYLRLILEKAGIEKKISPHKLRHTYAINLLNAGAELIKALQLRGIQP